MSVWRRKAIACLTDGQRRVGDNSTSIYEVFSEVLADTIIAHKENDEIKLKKYYDFAEWCFRQKDETLWNAAGVSFYEHLGDHPETSATIPVWIKKDIYLQIRGLLKLRLDERELLKIDLSYDKK